MNRRDFLRYASISGVMFALPSISFASANTDRRFIFMGLRKLNRKLKRIISQ